MAWFHRKSTTEIPELKEFYENEKTDRPLVAWTLALVSLLTTVIVVLGVFFAGSWLYGRVKSDKNQPVPAVTENEAKGLGQTNEVQPAPVTDDTESDPASTPAASTSSTSTVLPNTGPSEPEL